MIKKDLISHFINKMIVFYQGNQHDISHFLKVYSYAKTIGELEHLDEKTQFIVELSAIVHDISCPLCRTKYGNAAGQLQEKESLPLLNEFMKEFQLDKDIEERIDYIVCHHHTYTHVDGIDYQIMLEADYLVNADESHFSKDNIQEFHDQVFKTKSGIFLLENMYLR